MPRLYKLQHTRFLHLRPHPPTQSRQVRKTSQQIDLRYLARRLPHPSRSLKQLPPQLRKDSSLNLATALLRGQNLRLILLQLRRSKPLRIHQRLLPLVVRRH